MDDKQRIAELETELAKKTGALYSRANTIKELRREIASERGARAVLVADLIKSRREVCDLARILLAPYTRRIEPDDDGGYTATIVEWPGCVSEGETYEDAMANLTDAAIGWVLSAQDQGQPIPEPKSRWQVERARQTTGGTGGKE